MNLPFEWSHLPFVFVAIMIAFTVHEYAHAASAYRFGDPTAYMLGRVTLNPMSHVSIIGLLFIFLLGFGWARPVPINRANFSRPKMMSIIVSALGPFSNLCLAVFSAFSVYALFATGLLAEASIGVVRAVALTFFYLVHINLMLFIFNLLPLPPLDGYRILEDIAPRPLRRTMAKYEAWGVYIFLIIVFITPIFNVTIGPILAQVRIWRGALLTMFESIFATPIDWRLMFGG